MLKKISREALFKLLLAVLFSWCVALVCAGRSDLPKESNDTSVYAMHYGCLASGQGMEACNPILGSSPVEVAYQYLAAFCAVFLDFYLFKMLFAFAISLAIVWSVLALSAACSLPVLVLMVDFRFWEDVANVLRHGLAVAVFMVCFTVFIKYGRPAAYYLRYAAACAHLGSLFLLIVPTKKLPRYLLVLSVAAAVLLVFTSQYWVPVVTNFGFSEQKLAYYIVNNTVYEFALPLHYALVVFLGFFSYGKIKNPEYTASYNILVILVAGSILLGLLGLSYRSISMMLPFVVVCATHQIKYLSQRSKTCPSCVYVLLSIAFISLFMLAFIRNFDAFTVHLS